jgi:pyruvate-formate lyase-activating enzyme
MRDVMITLRNFSQNARFVRLIEFLKEVLDICSKLEIALVLEGSLAIFAYTEDQGMNVNDADLFCSETEFARIIPVLEERGIDYKMREWHVLQVIRDDLKVEFDSVEYWYKDLPVECEILLVDNYKVNMLGLNSLIEFYRKGMNDRVGKTDENEKTKYEALKLKFEMLEKIKG